MSEMFLFTQLESIFVCLICAQSVLTLVAGASLHKWRDSVVYYGDHQLGLLETIVSCSKLHGHLPIVHSREDIENLARVTGDYNEVWLGAEPEDKSFSSLNSTHAIDEYQWTDGTAFDFVDWSVGYYFCNSTCCGVSLYAQKMHAETCDRKYIPLCVLSNFTDAKVQAFVDSLLGGSVSTTEFFTMNSFEQQLMMAIKLNDTLNGINTANSSLHQRIHQLESALKKSSDRALSDFKLISRQLEQIRDESGSLLVSLSTKVDICLAILVLVTTVLAAAGLAIIFS